jgi:hypothetical protein
MCVVFLVLSVVSALIAVSNRNVNTIWGDEPLELGVVYAFLTLTAISFGAFVVMRTMSRSAEGRKAPDHFTGEDDRDPGVVRTLVRDGEVKRIGGKF